jgi:hypothetical protein
MTFRRRGDACSARTTLRGRRPGWELRPVGGEADDRETDSRGICMHAKWKELLWAIILVVVVTYLYIEVGRETALITATLKGYPATARPNFWPRVMLVGLLVTGLLKLLLNLRKPKDDTPEEQLIKYLFLPKVLISVGMVGAYCYLSQYLGFALSTMVFTAGYMWFLGMRKVKMLISFPILSTLVILLVFWRVLYIAVPKGEGIFLHFSNLVMAIVRVGA